jgi:Cu+-exporting ATPase
VAVCKCEHCLCLKEQLLADPKRQETSMVTSDFSVQGMTCSSCVHGIESYLSGIDGIKHVNVNLIANLAVVKHDPLVISAGQIKDNIEDMGYTAEILVRSTTGQLRVKLNGVSSEEQVARLSALLKGEDPSASLAHPIESIEYAAESSIATIKYSPARLKQRDIIAFINEHSAFNARLEKGLESAADRYKRKKEIHKYKKMFLISLFFAVPAAVMMILMATPVHDMMTHTFLAPGLSVKTFIMFVLSTPVQFWLGKGFFVAAGTSLRNKKLTMDSLIVIGTMAAYLYSIVSSCCFLFMSDATYLG